MTILEFKDKLVAEQDVPVYHIMAAPEAETPVVCWQELSNGHAFGDDGPVVDIVSAQVDYFTESEYDPHPKVLEQLFSQWYVYYSFEGLAYDNDREEWRYIWTVQFLGGDTGG